MAIPIGKLALYISAGGVSPFQTCPITLDAGTGREDLLDDRVFRHNKTWPVPNERFFNVLNRTNLFRG